MKRQLVILLFCVLLVVGLSACQERATPLASPTPSSPPTSTQKPSPTNTASLPAWTSTATFTGKMTAVPSQTVTPQPTATQLIPVRFAVIGDYGSAGKGEQEVASLILSWEPDFILTTGDNNYPNGTAQTIDENIGQYFHSYISPYLGEFGSGADENRFFPSLGNHDWKTTSADPYLDYFSLPGNERYYDFIWGPLHLFALDSDSHEPDGVGKSSVQAAWLKEALIASPELWNIVFFHHPPYSSGRHGDTNWMQWPFQEWGADVVLSGHDHTYERLDVDSVLYFVVGLGGASRYDFSSPKPGSQMRYNQAYGAMLVDATAEMITFSFYAVTGELIDTYSLTAGR